MPKTYSRSEWGARAANGGPGLLFASNVVGIALHWPAMGGPIRGVENVMAALRSWQAFHMGTRGWSDIAYQRAYDQDGNRYILRDLDVQSGANGNEDLNERFGALLLILAPGERPSPAMMKAVRADIADHRRLFHRSTQVVGHGQIRPGGTACPGPIVQGLVDAGAFEPGPSPRDLMRKDLTAAIRAAKTATDRAVDQGRTRVAKSGVRVVEKLRAARRRVPKD